MEWDEEEKYLVALEEQDESFVRIKPRLRDMPRRNPSEVAETVNLESSFKTTYRPSRHEAGWLLSSLGPFYEQNLISDVLFQVKGGKEANVYCCTAGSAQEAKGLLAAKVYRPREFRNLRNDRMYREGRPILTGEGRPVKSSDQRIMRALGKKSDFGVQVQHTSWLMYEYTTLERLYQAGVSVPEPIAASDNAVLMGYLGNEHGAAPTLSEVGLSSEEAKPLYRQVLQSIEVMLREGIVHGDLSAYNILYWEGTASLIDFPQVANINANPQARFILGRDITRVCEYFTRQGVRCDAARLERDLWSRLAEPDAASAD